MSNLYGVIGQNTPESLLAQPQADVIAIAMEPGNGEIKRGTLVYRKATGLWAAAATANVANTSYMAVLNETVDTGDSVDDGTVAETAAAYRTGTFIHGKVKYYNTSGSRYDVPTAAMEVTLARQGIFFDQSMESAPELDNGSYTITYVANNGVEPAEEDVEKYALAGSTYTVLNNSDASLSFTAPATKSFSKWNTKANGSGTDYAAAATYTANADLTLYAVWA